MIENPLTPSLNTQEPTGYFSSVIRVFFTTLIIAAAVYFFFNLVMGGIQWIGSGGDKASLENARKRVINSIIGIIVVFGSFIIINFIQAVFGIDIFGFNLNDLAI